jgi:hypothetical protein
MIPGLPSSGAFTAGVVVVDVVGVVVVDVVGVVVVEVVGAAGVVHDCINIESAVMQLIMTQISFLPNVSSFSRIKLIPFVQ